MCGITGWVSYQRDLRTDRTPVEAMTRTMACRGPDAEGIWTGRHIALGHRRLAVIDLSGGTQPMTAHTPDGRVVITYSGEAYNFTELRDRLRGRGHRFETSSDTEVVLRAYLEWGEAVAERLDGMYAFAIWDARDEKLVMVRDRLGIKPFFFHPTADGVLFASEPKAILAHPLQKRVITADGLREMLNGWNTPGAEIWSGMREVRPGSLVVVDRSGVRERTYWTLEPREHIDDLESTVAVTRELFGDIVKHQLVADVPQCVLLSGGLDSSSLTVVAARQLAAQGERVHTYSVDFAGRNESFRPDSMRATPDSPFVHDVADHVGAIHRDIVLPFTSMADREHRRAVIAARDFPVGMADVDVPLYLLFKAIREHSTVALSGEGADEVFAGYPWFHVPELAHADLYPWMAPVLAEWDDANATGMMNPGLVAALDLETYFKDSYRDAAAAVEFLPGEDEHERRMRIMCHLHLTRFLPMLLDRKDRISMAVGLEVRVPYCDHRLVEYVYNTPWSMKTFDGREKSLLRAAAGDLLPASVRNRVKSPFPSTQDDRYAGELQQQARELTEDADHPVFRFADRRWVDEVVRMDPADVPDSTREALDRTVDIATWLELHQPEIEVG
ncbi:asparagine synthase (glutamine-hydrolyzing) [Amycolatopsis jejuensis]|uniref:asparagine synthase (glutamine-hydrolyzing) n=1 Tax=Amycolatopsis jejuensis TaxID=330084 RepID=UPI000524EA6A|nr:asparagine synthase (glutamine-hydrolyzing) [Amycolatopsis jejuensis]